MIWILATSFSVASPLFDAWRDDTELSAQAWAAAVTCTGTEPQLDKITVTRDLPDGDWAEGRSSVDGVAMFIRLKEEATPHALANQMAHAWFSRESVPSGVVREGLADLLATCMQEKAPKYVAFAASEPKSVSEFPDLMSDPDAEALGLEGTVAAVRLMRAVASVRNMAGLWADPPQDMKALHALMTNAERGKHIVEMLDGGLEKQRVGLSDPDLDTLPTVQEVTLGMNPNQWDTDGDGWWDGATEARPEGAIPLPRDGTRVCMPSWSEDGAAIVHYGGNLYGHDPRAESLSLESGATLVGLRSELVDLAGGLYVTAHSSGELSPNPHCHWSARTTTVGELPPRHQEAASALAEEVERMWTVFEDVLGPAPSRLEIRVDGDHMGSDLRILHGQRARTGVNIPQKDFIWAKGNDTHTQTLAAHALAFLWLGSRASTRSPAAAEALAAGLVPGIADIRLVLATNGDVNQWKKAAKKCASGWRGVASGACR
jgi:hypothetical protein